MVWCAVLALWWVAGWHGQGQVTVLGKDPRDKFGAAFFGANGNAASVVAGLNAHALAQGSGQLSPALIPNSALDKVPHVNSTAFDLVALDVVQVQVAVSLGRTQRGDGGGGRFYYVAGGNPAHVNNGTVWRNGTDTGNWYWDLSQAGDEGIPVALFNVDRTGGVLSDAGIHAAQAFCAAPTYGTDVATQKRAYSLAFAPGTYLIDSIVNDKGVSWVGTAAAGVYPSGSAAYPVHPNGVVFQQRLGAVGDAIQVIGKSATLRNFTVRGFHERNTLPKRSILGVASRTSFTVSPLDLPGTYSLVGSYPYHSEAFFFSPGGYYLGRAIVLSVNSGTGGVTLLSGTDLYATPAGSGELLTTSCKVIFSPVVGYNFNGSPLAARPDPSAVGNAGIRLSHETATGTNPQRIENVNVTGFWTGVRLLANSWAQISQVIINNCVLAGVANAQFGYGSDANMDYLYVQGHYSPDDGSAEIAVDNGGYRRTYNGVYNPPVHSYINHIVCDRTVRVADFVGGQRNGSWGSVIADATVGGIFFFGDVYGDLPITFDQVMGRPPPNWDLPVPAMTGEAITVLGANTGPIHIGTLSLDDQVGNATSKYPYMFRVANAGPKVSVGHVGSISGVTAWRRLAEVNAPKVQAWDHNLDAASLGFGMANLGGAMGLVAGGKSSLFVWPNEQVVVGTDGASAGAAGTKVTLRASQVSMGGNTTDFFGTGRTSGVDKAYESMVPEHTPAAYPVNEFNLVSGYGSSTKNRVFVGGNPLSGRAAPTEVQIYAAGALHTAVTGGGPLVHVDGPLGRVGIKTVSPTADLSVNGTADKPGGGSWGTFSDRRLKEVLGGYTNGLGSVVRVSPVRYRYNGLGGIVDGGEHVGVVAQEFGEVFPGAVSATGPELPGGAGRALVVQQEELIWALVNAVKELEARVKSLEGGK